MNASGPAASGRQLPGFNRCTICDQVPTNPVFTECGHMYCRACLFNWLQRQVLVDYQIKSCFPCRTFVNIDLSIILMHGIGQVGESSPAAQNNRQYYPAQSQSIPPIRPTPPNLLPDVIVISSDSSSTEVSIAEECNVHEFQGAMACFQKESTTTVVTETDSLGILIKETIHTWAEIELVYDTIQRLDSEIRDVLMENSQIETFRGYEELIAMLFSLWLQAWLVGFIRLPSGFRSTPS